MIKVDVISGFLGAGKTTLIKKLLKAYEDEKVILIENEFGDIGDVASIGVVGFSMDNVASLSDCKKTIGDKMRMLGNVDPSNVMYAGTVKEVRDAVINCVLEGYDSPKGYTLMSGCSLPVETPLENIQVMMDTAREIGYPVDPEKLQRMLVK